MCMASPRRHKGIRGQHGLDDFHKPTLVPSILCSLYLHHQYLKFEVAGPSTHHPVLV